MEETCSEAGEKYEPADDQSSHSQDDLSSSVGEKGQARQKRKRTSPDDQALLEAAYKRDPKPDKIARLQLVEQVALTEKEVQIWFQNRRQSCRRKSGRPLLPHEIAQYQMARSTSLSHEHTGGAQLNELHLPTPGHEQDVNQEPSQPASMTQSHDDLPHVRSAQNLQHVADLASSIQYVSAQPSLSGTASTSSPVSGGGASHIGYLANRRSAPSLHRSQSETAMLHSMANEALARVSKKRGPVRLSMDAEGNAVVTTKDTSSPSPPRPVQSILSTETVSIPSPSLGIISSGARRSLNGRSRDSRSWEFWCDKDARSELENVAQKDSHGSATGAIGLIRSASGRSVLGPLNSKRNAPINSHETSAKRPKLGHKRSSLRRSYTSAGRLQGKTTHVHPSGKLKQLGSATTKYGSGADSDKENWGPDHNLSSDAASDDLSEQFSGSMTAQRLSERHGMRSPNKRSRMLRGGVADPEADPELSSFMSRGRESGSVAANADLDCIQGLLRLSQGTWRK